MSKPKITLYYDIVSPFAYLAFYALRNFQIFKQCEVTYVPIFLGGLMNKCGNQPPMRIKNKGAWIDRERQRWAELFSIPISAGAPPGFPPSTLSVQRALTALRLDPARAHLLPQASLAVWDAFWVRGEDVAGDQEVFKAALAKGLGGGDGGAEAAEKLLGPEGAGNAQVKEELLRTTEEAFAEGAFGLPWFVATKSSGEKEGFWGFDHIGQIVDFLGLERPREGGWRSLL